MLNAIQRPDRCAVMVLVLVVAASCAREPAPAAAPSSSPSSVPTVATEPYVPGLGEIMSFQQMRHTKLWLAGRAGNWDLAAYEVDELGEGFDDVLKLHPADKDLPVAPKDAIPRMVTQPIADLHAAVDKHDATAFAQAYDALTTACNNCHAATNHGFNRVQRPATNPYPNQVFEPAKK